jgi:hypothetical protein
VPLLDNISSGVLDHVSLESKREAGGAGKIRMLNSAWAILSGTGAALRIACAAMSTAS